MNAKRIFIFLGLLLVAYWMFKKYFKRPGQEEIERHWKDVKANSINGAVANFFNMLKTPVLQTRGAEPGVTRDPMFEVYGLGNAAGTPQKATLFPTMPDSDFGAATTQSPFFSLYPSWN